MLLKTPIILPYHTPEPHNNNQILPVGVVRVTFMTPSYPRGQQTWSLSQVSFLSESSTSKGILRHLAIIVQRQMDLRLMFPSIISLRTANLKKWTKLFTNLLALVLVYSVLIITSVTYISLCISFVLRENYFAYISLLHHHAHTISPNRHSYITTRS